MDEYARDIALIANEAKTLNQEQYELYYKCNKPISTKSEIQNIYNNYLSRILELKVKNAKELASSFSKRLIEHITGNYDIGFNSDFETINEDAETLSSLIASTENISELNNINSLETLVDGSVKEGLIYENQREKGNELFKKRSNENKNIFYKALERLKKIHESLVNQIASFASFNQDDSNYLNSNYMRKFIFGLIFELTSGTLIDKRHFTNIINSKIMLDKIENEGIIHFTSLETAKKIMETGCVNPSKFLTSDLTAKKSFFFAGIPKFEDLLINIPAHYVMTAVKIKPTKDQIKNLKYRPLNDGAVAYNGKFRFDNENAYIAYYGLKYNNETKTLYYEEISELEAKNYKVSDDVAKNYKNETIIDKIKYNAYGFFAEFKHYTKLRNILKTHSLRSLNDYDLYSLRDIEEVKVSKTK